MKRKSIFQHVREVIVEDRKVQRTLGKPLLAADHFQGEIKRKEATMVFKVDGSRAKGEVHVVAERVKKVWTFYETSVYVFGVKNQKKLDIDVPDYKAKWYL